MALAEGEGRSSVSASASAAEDEDYADVGFDEEEEDCDRGGNRGGSEKLMGCRHYKRKCKFYTPCCQKTYRCRFCHDSQESHLLQREDVWEVVCSLCGQKQEVRSSCQECGTVFGKYFCFECKLFDDEEKEQFHCDGCGICRIGGRDNFFHCPTCNMCLPAHLKGKHRCIENLSRSNCPICLEDIHTSREPSQIPPCNHLIHKSCFDALIQAGHFFCPVCARSLVNMAVMWGLYDQQIRETPLPKPYQDLYVHSLCRDCLRASKSQFHVLGLKCDSCGGYNTVREKGPLLRKLGDKYVEADLTSEEALGVDNNSQQQTRRTGNSSSSIPILNVVESSSSSSLASSSLAVPSSSSSPPTCLQSSQTGSDCEMPSVEDDGRHLLSSLPEPHEPMSPLVPDLTSSGEDELTGGTRRDRPDPGEETVKVLESSTDDWDVGEGSK